MVVQPPPAYVVGRRTAVRDIEGLDRTNTHGLERTGENELTLL